MRLWTVELDCWQRTKKHGRYAQCIKKVMLVEAEDSDAAFKAARNAVGLTAAANWMAIEDRAAYSAKLPRCLMTIKGQTIKLAADVASGTE